MSTRLNDDRESKFGRRFDVVSSIKGIGLGKIPESRVFTVQVSLFIDEYSEDLDPKEVKVMGVGTHRSWIPDMYTTTEGGPHGVITYEDTLDDVLVGLSSGGFHVSEIVYNQAGDLFSLDKSDFMSESSYQQFISHWEDRMKMDPQYVTANIRLKVEELG